MYLSGNGFRNIMLIVHRQVQDGQASGQGNIFVVDETLLQIEDNDYYWLWIAYAQNLGVCLAMHFLVR